MIKQIEILEHVISVGDAPLDKGDVFGAVCMASQEMYIDATLGNDVYMQTALHECVHIICALTGIELDESDTDLMALGFMSLVRNNPELISKLGRE